MAEDLDLIANCKKVRRATDPLACDLLKMSDHSTRSKGCPACLADPKRRHTDVELQQFHPKRYEYEKATAGRRFSKDFWSRTDAIMHDPTAPIRERVFAWIVRMSWGNLSLRCVVAPEGREAFQSDCANDLRIDKRRVSQAVAYYESRGDLERQGVGKVLAPVVAPIRKVAANVPSPKWRTFLEEWKATHPADFDEFEFHRAKVKNCRKVLLYEYRRWRANREQLSRSGEENSEGHLEISPSGERASSRTPPVDRPSAMDGNGSIMNLKARVREHLVSHFALPTPPDDSDVANIAVLLSDDAGLEQFRSATKEAKPRSWKLFACNPQRPDPLGR